MKRPVFGLALFLPIICFAAIASAQTVTGTLSGTLKDASGAVIPGVDVGAVNEQTGLSRTAVTNAEGIYLMPFLPIGNYTVTVQMPGFKKVVKNGVVIELNRTTFSDFQLEVAATATVVTVTGETPAIESNTGELKHSLTEQRIIDTPLAGRNFISLVEQIPGFQNAPWIGSSNNPTNSTGSYASFNGQGSRSATFQIDGVNNDDSSENQNRQNVNISTIKEFQVLTSAYSAEFGRAGGAVILVQTKSGTNDFHGDAFNFVQNDVFNANTFMNNRTGLDSKTGLQLNPRPIVRRNQYGGTIGGPVILPGFNGRNRLFFFGSAERVSNKNSTNWSRFMWLPGEEPRACNPGEVAKPGGPYCVDPATHPNLQRDLNYMRKVMAYWNTPELKDATPNDPVACADLIASGRPNRCVTKTVQNTFPDSDYTGRMDWKATGQDNISVRYQYSRQIRESGRIILGDNFGTVNNRQYNFGLTATHVFSGRQVGEFRYGFGNRATLQDVTDGNDIPTIRFSNTLCSATYCGTILGTSTNVPINRRQHDHQLVYNHSRLFDRHTLKFGIDQRFQLLDDLTGDRARGYWTFSTLDSLANIRALKGYTGWENFLLGFVTGFQQGYGNPMAENRFGETNLYLQDDFRLKPNLTFNLGVRWEYVRAPREDKDRFSYGFGDDKNNIEPRFGFAWSPAFENEILHAITGGRGRSVIRGGYGIYHSRLFQSIFSQNQLSIRTQPPNGYASDFSALCRNEISDPSCGFQFVPGTANRSPAFTAGGVQDIGGRLVGTLLQPDSGLKMPYTQQWNLTIERQLPFQMALQVGYNGNRGIGLPFMDSNNDAIFPFTSPSVLVDVGGGNFKPVVFDRACTDATDPICQLRNADGTLNAASGPLRAFSALNSATATLAQKGIVIEGGVPHGYISSSQPRYNERRPDPTYSRNVGLRNFTWSYYHAMIVKLTKRFSHDMSFNADYILSKSIDTGSEATYTGVDVNAPSSKKGGAAASLRGLSSYDARHRFVFSYSYLVPFFRSSNNWAKRLIGGWTLSGTYQAQSGTPFSVTMGYDVNADGIGGDRPRVADPSVLYRSVDDGRWLPGGIATDTLSQNQLPGTSFIPAQASTLGYQDRLFLPGTANEGTLGRNTFFTHGLNNWDASASKDFRIREGMKLSIRMEFYNLPNRVTFGVPASTIVSGTPMGRISGERNVTGFVNSGRNGSARQGQFSLRLVF